MEWLTRTFFEDPTYVCALLVIAAGATVAVWWERRERKWLKLAAVPLVVAVGLVVLARAVVTDRERIAAAMEAVAAGVERGDVDAAGRHVDEDFGGWRRSKAALLAYGREVLAKWPVAKVKLVGRPEIRFPQARVAECRLRTVVHLAGGDHLLRAVPITWELEWIKRPEGWRLRAARPSVEPPL